jgi:hypothetical protein
VKVFRTVVCAVIAALAATAMAEEAKPGPKFDFHGFIGGSLWSQDAVFNGFGQQIFFVTKQPNQDKLLFGGDARQTRLNFSLAGPAVFGGAIPKGVAELDFFSALNTTSVVTAVTTTTTQTKNAGGQVTNVTVTTTATSNPSITGPVAVAPRLRVCYAELNWGSTIFRMGQDNDLVLGSFAPTSVGHIPQSYGYGAGYFGTRHLDAEVFYTAPAGDMRVELALQVMSQLGGLADPFAGGGVTTAEASGIPAVEGRVRIFKPRLFDAYVVGHFQQFDRNGQDNSLVVPARWGDKQYVNAGSVGLKVTPGPLTLQGQAYVGKNLGNGAMTGGVGNVVSNVQGDFHEWGAWGQLGFNLTPEFSAWGFAGTERSANFNDAITNLGPNVRLANVTFAGMLRYMDGGYAFGLEFIHMHTRYGSPQQTALVGPDSAHLLRTSGLDGNQLMLSGMYFF